MTKEEKALLSLKDHLGYKELQLCWIKDITEIEGRRDSAASRGQESAWRYQAGIEKGYKKAVMKLEEEIMRLTEEEGNALRGPSDEINELMENARGENK